MSEPDAFGLRHDTAHRNPGESRAARVDRAPDFTDLLGVKFRRGGIDPATGLDCLGLVLLVRERMGRPLDIPGFDYSAGWKDRALAYLIDTAGDWQRVSLASARAGDLVVLEGLTDEPIHVGIMISRTEMIHATEGGVSIQRATRFEHLVAEVIRV